MCNHTYTVYVSETAVTIINQCLNGITKDPLWNNNSVKTGNSVLQEEDYLKQEDSVIICISKQYPEITCHIHKTRLTTYLNIPTKAKDNSPYIHTPPDQTTPHPDSIHQRIQPPPEHISKKTLILFPGINRRYLIFLSPRNINN